MGCGASAAGKNRYIVIADVKTEAKVEPKDTTAAADTAAKQVEPQSLVKAPSAKKAAAPVKKADGEASASQVVGGSFSPPKGPSPEDDIVIENWKSKGLLNVLEGISCSMPYKVTAISPDDVKGEAARAKAQEILDTVFKETESTFSHFIDTSEVSKINKLGADQVHKPSASMEKVLNMAATINRMTRGAFDPAILPLSQYFKENALVGDFEDAGKIAAYSKWSSFKIDGDGIKKTNDKAKLDLCGLAKGWAIDEICRRLKDAGFPSSFVDWGGDIKVMGKHPVGRNWSAAIVRPPSIELVGKAPADSKDYLAHVALRDGQSIATSGDYMQTVADGMSHILNPAAGAPCAISEETCSSISVVAQSCMVADALATAAMVKGKVKDARMMLDQFRGAQLKDPVGDYLLYTREGPRVVRMRVRGAELAEHAEDRLARHDGATVVVVGGGLAGISAALEAYKARAKVYIIEKEKTLGGNSAKATSGMNANGTRVQYSQGVDDDGRYFERDTHVSGKGGTSDISCVTMLSEKSAEGIHWLIDELGVDLTTLTQLGGHAKKRTHRAPPRADGTPVPVGYTIMQYAIAAAEGIPDITILKQCALTRLLKKAGDEREVEGVEYKDESGAIQQIKCDAVVLTTGGFGYDCSEGSLMAKHRPDLVGIPTTNGAFADGGGIKSGMDLGATLVDMNKVQLHPTGFIDPKDPRNHTKYLGPEALRGSGGILLNQQGRRFVNELDLRSVVSNAINSNCESKLADGSEYRPWAWCVMNEECQEKFGKPMIRFYKEQVGLFQEVQGTKGLSDLIGCSEANVVETLSDYAKACDEKICVTTRKVVFPSKVCETDGSFICAQITPSIHYCMGGLEIGSTGEVLTTVAEAQTHSSDVAKEASKGGVGRRAKVKRLFAAGECTGGVHGENRLGGNSLLECVVFGRLAGHGAATIKQSNDNLLGSGEWVPVTLREVRATDAKYGHNTAVYRFSLHGSLQHTGLEVGRFISIRGELDGDTVTGYYSPISRPDDEGIIDILFRTDDKGGPIVNLLLSMKPGMSCLMKGMGGPRLLPELSSAAWLYEGRKIRRLSLLAGGTGLAPALQISRAYFRHLMNHSEDDPDPEGGIKIIYAAESAGDLAFMQAFETLKKRFPKLIDFYVVLNTPPPGWTMGVGFVDQDIIRQRFWYPPKDDHLLVMCGPPIFEKIMCGNLQKMGYPREQYYSFDADPNSGT